MKALHIPAVLIVLAGGIVAAAEPAAPPKTDKAETPAQLKVYLPRNQQVSGGPLTVGAVCIVLGDNQRAAKARAVVLGRAPFSREEMRVDRAMILGRLAASGFSSKEIQFRGAPRVAVSLSEQEVGASRLVAAASAMLDKTKPCPVDAKWRLTGEVEPIAVASGPTVRLAPALTKAGTEGRAVVRVDVLRNGHCIAQRELVFTKAYLCRQAVARRDIPAGRTITAQDVTIESVYRPRPQAGWVNPLGKQSARAIAAGSILPQDLLTKPRAEIVFKRNALVRIRVDIGDFALVAKGMALSDGRPGEIIRVQNIDSKRILTARVCEDGTVKPLLEETGK